MLITNLEAQIITDRPSESTSIYIVNPGSLQFESGIQITSQRNENLFLNSDRVSVSESVAFPQLLFRYGIYRNFELRYNINLTNLGPSFDILDNSLGFKYRFYNSDKISFGTIVTLGATTYLAEAASYYVLNINIPIDISLSEDFSLTSNTIYDVGLYGTSDLSYLSQILLLGYSMNNSSLYVEGRLDYILPPSIDKGEYKLLGNIGYQYVINNNAIDFRLGIDRTEDMKVNGNIIITNRFFNIGYSRILF